MKKKYFEAYQTFLILDLAGFETTRLILCMLNMSITIGQRINNLERIQNALHFWWVLMVHKLDLIKTKAYHWILYYKTDCYLNCWNASYSFNLSVIVKICEVQDLQLWTVKKDLTNSM